MLQRRHVQVKRLCCSNVAISSGRITRFVCQNRCHALLNAFLNVFFLGIKQTPTRLHIRSKLFSNIKAKHLTQSVEACYVFHRVITDVNYVVLGTPYKQCQVRVVSHAQPLVPRWTELPTATLCLQHIVNHIIKLWAKHKVHKHGAKFVSSVATSR